MSHACTQTVEVTRSSVCVCREEERDRGRMKILVQGSPDYKRVKAEEKGQQRDERKTY